MIGRERILALVPHQGAMCLWDEVVDWDATRIRVPDPEKLAIAVRSAIAPGGRTR